MMSIRVDERHAYVEVEVYGAYETERFPELMDAMRGLAERHGSFSELEIHHGKPGNMFRSIAKVASGQSGEDFGFMKTMRKYALVSDNPGLMMRLAVFLGGQGPVDMRIFPSHERDQARQWIEEPTTAAATAAGSV